MNVVIHFDRNLKLWYSSIRTGNTYKRYVTWGVYRESCIRKLVDCGYASW